MERQLTSMEVREMFYYAIYVVASVPITGLRLIRVPICVKNAQAFLIQVNHEARGLK